MNLDYVWVGIVCLLVLIYLHRFTPLRPEKFLAT